jgi:uncharacterized protein (UPF0218 family)
MANMHSRSDNDIEQFKRTVRLPIELRNELKVPLGRLVSEGELVGIVSDREKIVTVGDICSLTLFKLGIIPDITIVDFKTRRGSIMELREEITKIGQIVINVNNPAGMITEQLWNALEKAYHMNVKVRIEVIGEEDMATLPSVLMASNHTVVIYGLPDIGMIAVLDMNKAKQKVKDVLRKIK